MAKPTLRFHYDTVSPWSYVAWEMVKRYRVKWGFQLELVPVNLGYVMHFSGNRPPITVANKGRHMWLELGRAADFYGVSLTPPSKFPLNTQLLQQHLHLLTLTSPALVPQLTDVYFRAIWHRNLPCASVSDVLHILTTDAETSSYDPDLWKRQLESATAKTVKQELKDQAKELVEEGGCFGMPWFIVTRHDGRQESFFGSDRFEQIAAFLHLPYLGPYADGRTIKL
ncbi:hypothetical protein ACQY0O_003396 [Thecaphora frezii]